MGGPVMIWVMFAAWAITAAALWEAWQYAKRWELIAAEWECQSKRWEQTSNRHKYTAEMWEWMYQGERDHV